MVLPLHFWLSKGLRHAGQVSSTDRQLKVSYGQMNHENLEKVTRNKAQVKTVTHLGASIFLIEGVQSLLAG
jgi:hypothetical protein